MQDSITPPACQGVTRNRCSAANIGCSESPGKEFFTWQIVIPTAAAALVLPATAAQIRPVHPAIRPWAHWAACAETAAAAITAVTTAVAAAVTPAAMAAETAVTAAVIMAAAVRTANISATAILSIPGPVRLLPATAAVASLFRPAAEAAGLLLPAITVETVHSAAAVRLSCPAAMAAIRVPVPPVRAAMPSASTTVRITAPAVRRTTAAAMAVSFPAAAGTANAAGPAMTIIAAVTPAAIAAARLPDNVPTTDVSKIPALTIITAAHPAAARQQQKPPAAACLRSTGPSTLFPAVRSA